MPLGRFVALLFHGREGEGGSCPVTGYDDDTGINEGAFMVTAKAFNLWNNYCTFWVEKEKEDGKCCFFHPKKGRLDNGLFSSFFKNSVVITIHLSRTEGSQKVRKGGGSYQN